MKHLLEQQRENFTKMMANTEKRVVQANMTITGLYSTEVQDDDKKKAAEYLSTQVYQLYDERRAIVAESDEMKQQNTDLQRLTCAQKIELEKYTAYIRQDGCGPTASLIGKVEELQDLLI